MKEKDQIKQAGKELSHDPYLRYIKNIPKPPLGMSIIDFSKVSPGPSIPRDRELGLKEENRSYPRDKGELLCRGATVGLDENGVCRHIWPHFAPQRFLGFAIANLENDQILVATLGAFQLRIPGIKPADQGAPVYASGPNTFTLEKQKAVVEIGIVRFVQPGVSDRASVAFKRYDSKEKLEPLQMR
jgi:hypothetical protein